ncbi:uncharacterized protein RAG0_09008 [Rhynchosporium agropyri]|uniref:Uncharacterized protein n=1 Tax=Rhynchosporium agropyri TaxID=914238 RepID=A0A1E1KTD3_9HELO|nr:uncharacterized protein RAG0_09008 [Rhynchosporium agropyri]
MRPTTPKYKFAQQTEPSSPPQTPTTASPAFTFKSRRNGMHFNHAHLTEQSGTITPTGNGTHHFSYTPFNMLNSDFSPRSTSSDSSVQHTEHSEDSDDSAPRSLSSSPIPPFADESPPRKQTKAVVAGNFILEEICEEEYEDWDSDDEDVIRPHQYEDAESDRAASVRSMPRSEIDPRVLTDFQNLQCENEDLEGVREIWLEKRREEKRRKRRSSGSVQKRTISQSIGSDTDEEDLKPITFEDSNEIGSSARRLRRKTKGERMSLVFDDPPPRIDEEDEGPESVEEIIEVHEGHTDREGGNLRELPYWYVQDMDVDSDDSDDSDDE